MIEDVNLLGVPGASRHHHAWRWLATWDTRAKDLAIATTITGVLKSDSTHYSTMRHQVEKIFFRDSQSLIKVYALRHALYLSVCRAREEQFSNRTSPLAFAIFLSRPSRVFVDGHLENQGA